jgi:hypothetical protein
MPVVMHYPWRIALFAGDNCTYCRRKVEVITGEFAMHQE